MLFRRREVVISSDDSNKVFYLNQGYIRLFTISKEGDELTLHIFSSSSVFPLLWSNQLDGYYFESLTPVEVYPAEKNTFQQFIARNSGANLEIMQQLTAFSESIMKKLESKIFGDAYQQVAATILDLAECFGQKDQGQATISYWFTHQDIANLTGLSRERVTMEINNLLKEKLISYGAHFINIPKLELLKEELEKNE